MSSHMLEGNNKTMKLHVFSLNSYWILMETYIIDVKEQNILNSIKETQYTLYLKFNLMSLKMHNVDQFLL